MIYTKSLLKPHHIRQNSKKKKERVKTRHSKIEIAQKYTRYPMFFSLLNLVCITLMYSMLVLGNSEKVFGI